MNLNENFHKGQCLPALHLMQNSVLASVENPAENPVENPALTPEGDLISFAKNLLSYQLAQLREENVLVVDLLTDDISDIKAEPSSNTQKEQKKKSILTIDELIKWLSKSGIKNNKKLDQSPYPKQMRNGMI
ncbi:842_t:CDS:1 [Funneliformis mosseae]|uniref:842_t:CDS:1 n=1 Tax=Funneliformis mosseae TaxID=27381 RepID=A0A9N8ZH14_FUNMO|nr:842_t:CDS:1 [Funneliformis mosseae]